jgi:serine/threonine protein kinase
MDNALKAVRAFHAFDREAEFLQMLDHPNIVEVYDVVENEKQMVIKMEWLRGGHLLDKLEEMAGQHYSEQQAAVLFVQVCSISNGAGRCSSTSGPSKSLLLVHLDRSGCVQLADALEHMHSYNIINRDIKAENIVFKDTAAAAAAKGVPPIVKFIDLGMATLYDKDHPQSGETPCVLAPQ